MGWVVINYEIWLQFPTLVTTICCGLWSKGHSVWRKDARSRSTRNAIEVKIHQKVKDVLKTKVCETSCNLWQMEKHVTLHKNLTFFFLQVIIKVKVTIFSCLAMWNKGYHGYHKMSEPICEWITFILTDKNSTAK